MSRPATYVALRKVEFDYEATTEEELTVTEDQLVWVIEDDDADWHKVKIKSTEASSAVGLVPASYLGSPTPLRTVRAVYDYAPALTDNGELENEEEMEIVEGEVLTLWEDDGDWVLVGRDDGKGVGFVPGTYIEDASGGVPEPEPKPEDEVEEQAVAAPIPYVDPSERVASSKAAAAKTSEVKTWPVTEIDKKKKKKKGTLGVGNGAIFFASDSDKTPVQQYSISTLDDVSTEKSKHIHLTFPTVGELHFVIGSTDAFNEIIAKIDDERVPSIPPRAVVPARSASPPHSAVSAHSNGVYIPPPPPVRANSSTPTAAHVSPPVRSLDTPAAQAGNATALYDFVAEGDDELPIVEGERLVYLGGGSDDPDWVKVRKVDSESEGVVPATYVQMDDGSDAGTTEQENSQDDEAARMAAEAEARADAEDKARLAAELREAERARRAKVAADREVKERKANDEAARQRRLQDQPKAAPIPLPDRNQLNESPPPLAARPRENGSSRSSKPSFGSISEPSPKRVRTWKDRTGQFKVEAEFLGMNGHKIRLHKLNGVTIEVPMEKMSAEDQAYLKKINSRSSTHADDSPAMQEERRNRHHLRAEQAASSAGRGEASSSSKPTLASAKPRRKQTDWFEFFLNAGCDVDDCTRYGHNFEREKIEEELVADIEGPTLRTLGLREGDIIRVLKYIKEKYAPPPTPDKGDREAQIASDAAMARQLAGPTPPPPNLFTNADGNLKTRRGRPTPNRQVTSSVDPAALLNASSELTKRVSTPPISRVASPPAASASENPKRSSSTIPQLGGFDDDAWTVKHPSTPSTPVPIPVTPTPPTAPNPPTPPPAPSPALISTTDKQPPRTGSAGVTEGLTYNDGLLAQLGVGIGRSPSAPAMSSQGTGNGSVYGNSPSPVSTFNPNAPRGPILPTAQNQALLAPLVPTQTGFLNRGHLGQGGLMPQMTGYSGASQLTPAFTGMTLQNQTPQFTNMQAPMQMQTTGFQQPPQMTMSMQPTGFSSAQQMPTFLQSQPTGFLQPQGTGVFQNQQPQSQYNQIPARFSPAPPVQFNPTPPSTHSAAASSTTEQFKPNNIFASMKDGSFAGNSSQLGPQNSNKYDALRPQPTGYPQQQGLQPQMTGAYGMLQPQQTGFPGQQPMYPQQTGMYNQFQQRQF